MPARSRLAALAGALALLILACAPGATPSAPAAPTSPAAPAAASAPRESVQPVTLNFGMTGPQAVYWGSFVGMEQGFFAAEGITLDPVYMDTSVRNATALVGGSLDVAGTSPDTIILATEKGADLVVIGEEISKPVYSIVADPQVPDVASLKGRKVAHSGAKSGTTWMLLQTLAYYGVKESDVDMVLTGGTSSRYAALKSGAVAAAAMLQPDDFRVMDEGFRRIAMSTVAIQDFTFNTYNVRRDWARQHDAELVRLLRGFRRAMDWLNDPANKEEAIAVLMKRTQQEEQYARQTYDLSLAQERMFAEHGAINLKGLQAVLEQLADSEELSRPLPSPQKYVDTSYWERAGS
jgi:NitT/TauT family transport system substrate-binding protein